MLDLDLWLFLGASICLCLQAALVSELQKWVYALLLFPLLAFFLGPWLSHFSVLTLHQVLLPVASFLGVCVLLESLLLINHSIRKKPQLVLFSPLPWLAFIYLQMRFYQTGWLDLTFHYQALIYGFIIAFLYWLIANTAQRFGSYQLVATFCVFQWTLVLLRFSRWPVGGAQLNPSADALVISLSVLLLTLLLGYGKGLYLTRLPKRYKK